MQTSYPSLHLPCCSCSWGTRWQRPREGAGRPPGAVKGCVQAWVLGAPIPSLPFSVLSRFMRLFLFLAWPPGNICVPPRYWGSIPSSGFCCGTHRLLLCEAFGELRCGRQHRGSRCSNETCTGLWLGCSLPELLVFRLHRRVAVSALFMMFLFLCGYRSLLLTARNISALLPHFGSVTKLTEENMHSSLMRSETDFS